MLIRSVEHNSKMKTFYHANQPARQTALVAFGEVTRKLLMVCYISQEVAFGYNVLCSGVGFKNKQMWRRRMPLTKDALTELCFLPGFIFWGWEGGVCYFIYVDLLG